MTVPPTTPNTANSGIGTPLLHRKRPTRRGVQGSFAIAPGQARTPAARGPLKGFLWRAVETKVETIPPIRPETPLPGDPREGRFP